MRKRIGIIISAVMVMVILYYAISSSGVLDIVKKKSNNQSTATKEYSEESKKNLSSFELNAMESANVTEVLRKEDTAHSCGCAIRVLSYKMKEGMVDVPEIEGYIDYFKSAYGDGTGKVSLVVDIEITNVSVEEYFKKLYEEGGEFLLCLGNIWANLLDSSGQLIESEGIFACSNNKAGLKNKNAWLYTFDKGEKYTGKLVYVMDKNAVKNAIVSIKVALMSNKEDISENKMIVLS